MRLNLHTILLYSTVRIKRAHNEKRNGGRLLNEKNYPAVTYSIDRYGYVFRLQQ